MSISGEIAVGLKEVESLSSLSPAAIEILNIIDKPHTGIDDISNLVALDKSLYANVFKYANSAALALRRSPQSIQEAINYLGIYGLRDLIFILSARKLFSQTENWSHSVFVAFCSKKLAQKLGMQANETSNIYIAALMHDIGAMVLHSRFNKEYKTISQEENLTTRYKLEKLKFGTTSAQLSAEILSLCGLPKAILNIIRNLDKDWTQDDYTLNHAIINLANSLAYLDYADEKDIEELMSQPQINKFALNQLNINSRLIHKLHQDIRDFVDI